MYAKQHEPPEESSEFEWHLYAPQGKVKVRREIPREEVRKTRETPRSSELIYVGLL